MARRFRLNQANFDSKITKHSIMTTTVESQQLNSLVERCGGTENGAKWLKLAVDPFHDVDLELVGFPDQTPGRSVIYNVTKNITITKPDSVGANEKFDAHVSFIPVVHSDDWAARGVSSGADGVPDKIYAGTYSAKRMGSGIIQVCTVPAGSKTFVAGSSEEYNSIDYSSLLDPDGSSLSRLIGCAFEVHNTTEELHKSGAVTVYRFDTNKDTESLIMSNNASPPGDRVSDPFTSTCIHGPPNKEPDAKLLNGITWEAAEGCLVPCVMDTDNQPQKYIPRRNHIIVSGPNDSDNTYWAEELLNESVTLFGPSDYLRPVSNVSPSMILPFMCSGAYFTGLSAQTSLTVTMRAFVEVFPSPGNALVPLAHPSSPYDAKVLQCYSEIMSELHAGYPVRDNAAGDFFRKAYAALKHAIAIGRMIPGGRDIAEAMSSGVKSGEALYKAVTKKKGGKK